MSSPKRSSGLADDLGLLASALEMLDLRATEHAMGGLAATRDRLARSIRSYLIPRLSDPDAPLSVVFAGPTGSGKSTLVNSLSGLDVSRTGPLRPTTTGPVVLASERHIETFSKIGGVDCDVMAGRAPILSSLALIDTPDIDSTSTQNRVIAEIVIDNADIVVFVTSALRYADLVPWEVLRRAASRGAPLIYVLNRVGSGSTGAITDYRSRLDREGLGSRIVRVPEHHIAAGSHRVPSLAVRELRRRLLEVASDMAEDRRETFSKVLGSTSGQVLQLADELDSALTGAERHRELVRASYQAAARQLDLEMLCEGMAPDDPPEGRLRRLAWRRRNRLRQSEWAELRGRLARRLVALVDDHLRHLVLSDLGTVQSAGEELESVRRRTAQAAEAWTEHLEGIAGVDRGPRGRLAAVALADASARGRPTPAFDALFDDKSTIARSYRALLGRLEAVYFEAGAQVAALAGAPPVTPGDTDRLREAASTVVARSHFADA